ncbi:hypothetical protein [Mesorhizobium sp. M0152]|uniref:hypothetical protein n=1 Tax=Mesorhizobium sp. M0152 TaxID=2956898 RepID=UPI00333985B2
MSLLAADGDVAFHAVEALELFPETFGNLDFRAKRRQGPQKALHRFGAELTPDLDGEPFSFFALVAAHHLESCVGCETPPAGKWFPDHGVVASNAEGYGKI